MMANISSVSILAAQIKFEFLQCWWLIQNFSRFLICENTVGSFLNMNFFMMDHFHWIFVKNQEID